MQRALLIVLVLVGFVAIQAKGDFVCKQCQVLANDLLKVPEANQTYELIDQELTKICQNLLSSNPLAEKECERIVDNLVADLQNLGLFLGKGWSGYALCTMINICDYYCCLMPYRPEQVHIAVTNNPSEMMVTFITGEPITPTVEWGEQNCNPAGPIGEVVVGTKSCNFTYSAVGTSKTYTQGSWQGQIHNVLLTGLQPTTTYYYRVGDPYWDWSTHNFNFTSAPVLNSPTDPGIYKIAAYGDMGASDASDANIFLLQEKVQSKEIDLILHAGDISYANGFQYVWDDYLRKVEYYTAYVPYMTAVGNHELFYNFTAFKERFSMPGASSLSGTNMYFSFNYGPAHIIAYSFEQDAGYAPEMHPGGVEYQWLQQDLIWANAPENRTTFPWLIMYGHRPFYCSNTGTSNEMPCEIESAYYRSLVEPLMYQYKVDLVITAHVHDYERTLPVYNETVVSTSYDNPGAPTYVVVGTGGNREGNSDPSTIPKRPPAWSVSHLDNVGFGLFYLTNTTLDWTFIDATSDTVLDQFTLSK